MMTLNLINLANLSPAECISSGALIVSVMAALISFKSMRNSTAALAISQSDHGQKQRSVAAYLIKSVKINRTNKETFASFAVSYTNHASISNSISQLELVVHYIGEDDRAGKMLFPALNESLPHDLEPRMQPINSPLNIPARSAVTGWLTFKLSDQLKSREIKKYEVIGVTSDNQKISIECFLLMSILFYDQI